MREMRRGERSREREAESEREPVREKQIERSADAPAGAPTVLAELASVAVPTSVEEEEEWRGDMTCCAGAGAAGSEGCPK